MMHPPMEEADVGFIFGYSFDSFRCSSSKAGMPTTPFTQIAHHLLALFIFMIIFDLHRIFFGVFWRLTALKRAYADIILTTAKEAAARMMKSEKRALRFQQELSATKQESLRLLLRLKQMNDCKVREADMVSVNQQRKIEVLEAQLHEAEDIVRDLREEVHDMKEELEKMKNKQMQHPNKAGLLNGHREFKTLEYANGEESLASLSRLANRQIQKGVTTAMDTRLSDIYDCGRSGFPSIIRKHPKLDRNGCIQRIHASERSLLDSRLVFRGEDEDTDSDSVEISDSEVELVRACMMENATSKSICSTVVKECHDSEIPSELNNNDVHSSSTDIQRSVSGCEAPSQPKNGQSLKCTFVRKRKKDTLSSCLQRDSLDKCTSKQRRTRKSTRNSSDLPKPSMMAESTRDSRRVAQVARQLISLSGKRWR